MLHCALPKPPYSSNRPGLFLGSAGIRAREHPARHPTTPNDDRHTCRANPLNSPARRRRSRRPARPSAARRATTNPAHRNAPAARHCPRATHRRPHPRRNTHQQRRRSARRRPGSHGTVDHGPRVGTQPDCSFTEGHISFSTQAGQAGLCALQTILPCFIIRT